MENIDTPDGFSLKSAEYIGISVGQPKAPTLIIYKKPFKPVHTHLPKRFSREKRKVLRAKDLKKQYIEYVTELWPRPIEVVD